MRASVFSARELPLSPVCFKAEPAREATVSGTSTCMCQVASVKAAPEECSIVAPCRRVLFRPAIRHDHCHG